MRRIQQVWTLGKHSRELSSDTSLPDELNYFYATCMRAPAVPENCVTTFSTADVSTTFKQVNIHKAAGPDSSAFNTIVPSKLINKLRTLGLNTSLWNWILDFLTDRPQVVRVGKNLSTTLILNMGPSGVCAQFPPVLPVHSWLHGQARLQYHHSICRWHNSGRPDHWQDRL